MAGPNAFLLCSKKKRGQAGAGLAGGVLLLVRNEYAHRKLASCRGNEDRRRKKKKNLEVIRIVIPREGKKKEG